MVMELFYSMQSRAVKDTRNVRSFHWGNELVASSARDSVWGKLGRVKGPRGCNESFRWLRRTG
jgi:hypothetical protein